MSHSRRTFLKSSAAAAAASAVSARFSRALPAAPQPLHEFAYGDVQLLDGPMREQFDANHAFYSSLNEDSLLKPFRQRAGLPAPGQEMGGWYSWAPLADLDKPGDNGFAPAHSFGQYLSGLARDYAATGNKATQQKVHRLVSNLGPAIHEDFWRDNRFPSYTSDKLTVGLIDAHQFAGAPDAFAVLNKVVDSVQAHLPPGGISRDAQAARPHPDQSFAWDEPYTMSENAFLAFQRGAGARYRDYGVRFLPNDWYFDPLARGENVLPGKHAYSHVNCLSSAMQAYFVLGDEKYLSAARNGFQFVMDQSFATGGWGPDETFRSPGSGELGQSLTNTHSSFETPCGSYAMSKITRYLTRATRDSRYGDTMDRVLYNCILGAKPIAPDGHAFYYSDYSNDGSKFYHQYKWHCCTGSFSQVTADYGINSYFHDGQGMYVNLFVPSRVKWNRFGHPLTVTQRTRYPHEPSTSITITTDRPVAFPLHLRVPAWAGPKTRIAINGKAFADAPAPGRFATIERTWKNGDRVEMEFDMPTTLEAVDPQHPNLIATVHGPLALFSVGAIPADLGRADLMRVAQTAEGSTDWQVKTPSGALALRPFTAIEDEHYRLYLDVKA